MGVGSEHIAQSAFIIIARSIRQGAAHEGHTEPIRHTYTLDTNYKTSAVLYRYVCMVDRSLGFI